MDLTIRELEGRLSEVQDATFAMAWRYRDIELPVYKPNLVLAKVQLVSAKRIQMFYKGYVAKMRLRAMKIVLRQMKTQQFQSVFALKRFSLKDDFYRSLDSNSRANQFYVLRKFYAVLRALRMNCYLNYKKRVGTTFDLVIKTQPKGQENVYQTIGEQTRRKTKNIREQIADLTE